MFDESQLAVYMDVLQYHGNLVFVCIFYKQWQSCVELNTLDFIL